MEILFGNKGIYHYMDAKVGTMQELEEHGRMYQVRMLVENELPYILPSSMICTDAEVWLSHNTKDCYGLQAYLHEWDTVKESFESDHAAGGRIGSIFARCIGSGYPRGVFVHAKGEKRDSDALCTRLSKAIEGTAYRISGISDAAVFP